MSLDKNTIKEQLKSIVSNEHLQQMEEGDSFLISTNKDGVGYHIDYCCDCGLCHIEFYEVVEAGIKITVFRSDYLTDIERKSQILAKKIEKETKGKDRKQKKD